LTTAQLRRDRRDLTANDKTGAARRQYTGACRLRPGPGTRMPRSSPPAWALQDL